MFWLFTNKKRVEEIREETKTGFNSVKKDILSIGDWIKHLDSEKNGHKDEINQIKQDLSSIKEELEEIKNNLNIFGNYPIQTAIKTNKNLSNKQTIVQNNQNNVQTLVQTPKLDNFSITERAIIGVLLNSDLKLSYEDLAALLGKEKSTIRGQINSIKSKSESLIEESIEKNGKKRVFVSKELKNKLLKKAKVSENKRNKDEEDEEN